MEEEFTNLYRRERGRIFALCWRRVPDRQEAEDLTHEVFTRAWQAGRTEPAWLTTVARNLLIDYHRTRHDVPAERLPDTPVTYTPEHAAIATERRTVVRQALGTLPDNQRRVVVMQSKGYSVRETADELDMTVAAVKMTAMRARRKLGALIAGALLVLFGWGVVKSQPGDLLYPVREVIERILGDDHDDAGTLPPLPPIDLAAAELPTAAIPVVAPETVAASPAPVLLEARQQRAALTPADLLDVESVVPPTGLDLAVSVDTGLDLDLSGQGANVGLETPIVDAELAVTLPPLLEESLTPLLDPLGAALNEVGSLLSVTDRPLVR